MAIEEQNPAADPVAKKAASVVVNDAAVTSYDVSLDEFCMRLSQTDKRVELIGGFHYTESAAGHAKDAESAFQSRFADFVNKPV